MRGAVIGAVIGAVMMLAGCAAGPHIDTPSPAPRVVTLDRVVSETCLRPATLPSPPARVGALLNGEARHDAEVLASAVLADRAWESQAQALLVACAGR